VQYCGTSRSPYVASLNERDHRCASRRLETHRFSMIARDAISNAIAVETTKKWTTLIGQVWPLPRRFRKSRIQKHPPALINTRTAPSRSSTPFSFGVLAWWPNLLSALLLVNAHFIRSNWQSNHIRLSALSGTPILFTASTALSCSMLRHQRHHQEGLHRA
jgi:hypothetical protein